MPVFISAVGLCASGIGNWAQGQEILCGRSPYLPGKLCASSAMALPANESRRAVARLVLRVAQEAVNGAAAVPARLPSVFACSGGDPETLEHVLSALVLTARPVSPRQFAYVGHNAPASFWSMMTRSDAPSTSLGAYDGSFAAGLLEAVTQVREGVPVLLVAYDVPPPPLLAGSRPVAGPFAAALLLASERWPNSRSRITVTFGGDQPEGRMDQPELEALRTGNPAARCLPLLRLIATGASGAVVLPYASHARVTVEHTRC